MSKARDELDALRAAWQRLEAPEHITDARRADEDPETRACVDWMARAWDALEAPPAKALPTGMAGAAPRRPRPLRRQVLLRALPFAAAASVLFLLQVRRPAPAPQRVELAQAEPIRPVVLADGSVETRSGKVRLILLPDATPQARPDGAGHEPPTPELSSPGRKTAEPPMENSR